MAETSVVVSSAKIRIKIYNESACLDDISSVKIFDGDGDKPIAQIIASIEYEKGADGGQYPIVKLKLSP